MSGLHSLEKVLVILDLFTEDKLEWTPEQLMRELGYTRPTLYRYLKVLREAGLLTSLPGAGLMLGPRVVEMDYLMRKSDPLLQHGADHLHKLTQNLPCTALLVRWYGRRLLCIASEVSTSDPLSSYPRGRPMPLGRGAISRSIMAFLPRARMVTLIEENIEELRNIGLGTTVPEIVDGMKNVQRVGYAVAYGEVTPGVVGIAAPVFDATNSPIASLCVTVAGSLITPVHIDELGQQVMAAATDISARLQHSRATTPNDDTQPKQPLDLANTDRRRT
jgi:DNA-binding IclR family transcriptional regulator